MWGKTFSQVTGLLIFFLIPSLFYLILKSLEIRSYAKNCLFVKSLLWLAVSEFVATAKTLIHQGENHAFT